ncbi:MFS transporter [Streptomyces turgidiscabies]|nr:MULTISPECIES: MFS transporter [Streptomyces]MDX3498243.1 MFS transporter [Streptomyces turgidiscabies]GAQ75216.1 multidrug efflux system protein MdtL [Streptomyces turgidiscabies]
MRGRLPAPPRQPQVGARSHRPTVARGTAFWLVAAAFAVTMMGTTLPTPLYPLYQHRLGFSTLMTTVIFSAYAVGVVTALVLFGRVSDVLGRRRTLLPGLACAAASGLVFLAADSLPLLIAGRLLSGLSAGIFTGTATAALVDLADEKAGERATLVATVANMGGLGAGPLLAGLLAQLAPAPLRLPFKVHLGMLVLATVGVWLMPEPVRITGRPRLRVTRPRVPEQVRATFVRASIAGFASFAVLGLFTAVAPSFLGRLLHLSHPALSGGVVCTAFAASTIGQITLVRPLGRAAMSAGCGLLIAGMALLITGLATESLALLVGAAVTAGLGQGVSFRAGLTSINTEAPTGQRAEVASTYFIVLYVAISAPVVGVGVAADVVGLRAAGIGFAVAVALLAVSALVAVRRGRREQ